MAAVLSTEHDDISLFPPLNVGNSPLEFVYLVSYPNKTLSGGTLEFTRTANLFQTFKLIL